MSTFSERLYDHWRFNWFIYPGILNHRSADFLHRYYEWRRMRMGPLRIFANALVVVFFWLWVPVRARKVARLWAKDSAWRNRVVPLARKWLTDPEDFATFDMETESDLRVTQRRMEQIPIIRTIESPATDHASALLNKAEFQSLCEQHLLAVPLLYGTIEEGELAWRSSAPGDAALLVKPRTGSGGRGIVTVAACDLPDMISAGEFAEGTWLVQECLAPHADLADIALDALPTVRMVTLLDEAGAPELVTVAFRFAARPGVAVDNGHAGGLIAGVDMTDGTLGDGLSGWGPGCYPTHPVTGAPIGGRVLPDWSAAKALAVLAHERLFPKNVIIGWDLGMSSRGPVLVEANPRPAVRLTQRSANRGIGEMRYGELLAFHLDRAIAADPRRKWRYLAKG